MLNTVLVFSWGALALLVTMRRSCLCPVTSSRA
jgi:hypothetical protein